LPISKESYEQAVTALRAQIGHREFITSVEILHQNEIHLTTTRYNWGPLAAAGSSYKASFAGGKWKIELIGWWYS